MSLDDFQGLLEKYVEDVKRVASEANKSFFFIQLVQNTFKTKIDYLEKVFPQIEKFVQFKGKTVISRGEIDSLLGNVIIEFESDIDRKKDEADGQLRRYVSILWNIETREYHKRVSYVAIGTDGLRFYVYRPESTKEGELSEDDISLIPIEQFVIESKPARDIHVWLDYTFLSKEARVPTTEGFTNAFGVGTNFYKSIFRELQLAIETFGGEKKENFDTLFSEWSKYLSIAYGSNVESKEFFIKHTYLSILAKLMIYSFLSKGVVPIEEETVLRVLGGEEFKKWGIRNFFEEDFFSWITREPAKNSGVRVSRRILEVLVRFDLTRLNEDILKGLYENLLDKQERHDLGEVYTPDWLVESILRSCLRGKPDSTILDPACGSGTFLFIGIKVKKELMKEPHRNKILTHILESVKGVDIHPLAVLIAKTNYLLALGDLVRIVPRGEIVLPVYMADSIRLIDEDRTFYQNVNCYRIPTIDDENFFFLPCDFVEKEFLDTEKIDSLIDLIKELSADFLRMGSINEERVEEFLSNNLKNRKKLQDYVSVICLDVRTFARITKLNRDTIWAYILKNKHKPIDFTYRKFDCIVGNPPWIVYNSVKNTNYQQFLKRLIKDEYGLVLTSGLMTNMEIATLFYLRCMELYLKKNDGEVAFVMPRSVFQGDQHSNFRNGLFKRVKNGFSEIWDLDKVRPLFKIPSCVVFGRKNVRTEFPVGAKIFQGKLERKNEEYRDAMSKISISEGKLFLSRIGKRDFLSYEKIEFIDESYYYDKFYRGAEILPQTFWLVDVLEQNLGYDAEKPYVKTAKVALLNAKKPWNEIVFEGNVEADFIYEIVICSYLFPFSFKTSKAVLPIEQGKNGYRLITREEPMAKYPLLARWLEKAEDSWNKGRKEKKKFNIYQWIDYSRKLTRQNPNKRYKIFYNKTGKDIVATVANIKKYKGKLVLGEATIYFETDNGNEAYYLAAMLNSPAVNRVIKPMQAKGLWGERGIEKKVLELPFPKYSEKNANHRRIAEMGRLATARAEKKLEQILGDGGILKPQHVARVRRQIRDELKTEIEGIDDLTQRILIEDKKSRKSISDFFKEK
jgi:type I restriction-modification system DNA methylase subunit